MTVDAETLKAMIEAEVATLSDARVVTHILSMLVEPHVVLRGWDYGTPGQQYPCWNVLNDSSHSGAVIAYCEFGFEPKCPWGLVGSGTAPADSQMGMDSGWFSSFLDAYFESYAASGLPIWKVFRQEADLTLVQLTPEGTWENTWNRLAELRSSDPAGRYLCDHSISYGTPSKMER